MDPGRARSLQARLQRPPRTQRPHGWRARDAKIRVDQRVKPLDAISAARPSLDPAPALETTGGDTSAWPCSRYPLRSEPQGKPRAIYQ